MKRVLLVANQEKDRAIELAAQTREFLRGRAEIVEADEVVGGCLGQAGADLAVVFGGDGTVLDTVKRLGERQIPLLTINLGRLGFLAEVSPERINADLERVLAGDYKISRRMMLEAEVLRGGEVEWQGRSLNEFAFITPEHGRMCHLNLGVDCGHLITTAGDGVLVATATGSTGYALSAGGPILNPELRAALLVPLCPHLLSNRPLVLGEHETLTVSGNSIISCDGRKVHRLDEQSQANVRCSEISAQIILGSDCGRYDVLRKKLGWGNK